MTNVALRLVAAELACRSTRMHPSLAVIRRVEPAVRIERGRGEKKRKGEKKMAEARSMVLIAFVLTVPASHSWSHLIPATMTWKTRALRRPHVRHFS